MENVNMNAAQTSAFALNEEAIAALAEAAKSNPGFPQMPGIPMIADHSDNMLGRYNNAVAGMVGGLIAAGLELASPTGTKASAACAVVGTAAAVVLGRKVHTAAPQNKITMGVSALIGFKAGRCVGRLSAEYFPPVMEVQVVEAE